jgi:hypothetical protein
MKSLSMATIMNHEEEEETMKMAVFWDVEQCSLVDTDRRFRGPYYLHHQGPDDGGSKHL